MSHGAGGGRPPGQETLEQRREVSHAGVCGKSIPGRGIGEDGALRLLQSLKNEVGGSRESWWGRGWGRGPITEWWPGGSGCVWAGRKLLEGFEQIKPRGLLGHGCDSSS